MSIKQVGFLYKLRIIPFFLAMLICGAAHAGPDSEAGAVRSLVHTGPGDSKFFVPQNWFLKTEILKGTFAIFISKEDIDKEKLFKTGFSLNVIVDIPAKSDALPSEYANAFVSLAGKKKETLIKPWGRKVGPFIVFGTRVKDNVKIMEYLLVANDKTGTLYLAWFEAPTNDWDKEWPAGKAILQSALFDPKI